MKRTTAFAVVALVLCGQDGQARAQYGYPAPAMPGYPMPGYPMMAGPGGPAMPAGVPLKVGSMKEAKTKGVYRLEGKTYVVQDGDIMHILSSV